MTLYQFLFINFGALLTAVGGVFLKRLSIGTAKSDGIFELVSSLAGSWYFWAGGICYIVPVFIWAYLLRTMDLTKLQPLLAIVYVYTLLLGILLLDEQPSGMRLLGITIVITGVVIVGRT